MQFTSAIALAILAYSNAATASPVSSNTRAATPVQARTEGGLSLTAQLRLADT